MSFQACDVYVMLESPEESVNAPLITTAKV